MNKALVIGLPVALGMVLVGLGAGYVLVLKPKRDLELVAEDTCRQLDAAIVLQVGPILDSARLRAAELGFDATELGDAMTKSCPYTMDALRDWADRHQKPAEPQPTPMMYQ